MSTKIIFLDIDGVLNSGLYYKSGRAGKGAERRVVDPHAVGLLNDLIKETGAKIVVSSSMRHGRSVAQLQELLDDAGFLGEVIDKTRDLRSGPDGQYIFRGNEIYAWLDEHKDVTGYSPYKYRHYIILDDDSDMLYWQREHFFPVDAYCGLTPNIVYRAIRFLNS